MAQVTLKGIVTGITEKTVKDKKYEIASVIEDNGKWKNEYDIGVGDPAKGIIKGHIGFECEIIAWVNSKRNDKGYCNPFFTASKCTPLEKKEDIKSDEASNNEPF